LGKEVFVRTQKVGRGRKRGGREREKERKKEVGIFDEGHIRRDLGRRIFTSRLANKGFSFLFSHGIPAPSNLTHRFRGRQMPFLS
jgi:hypothetical protein